MFHGKLVNVQDDEGLILQEAGQGPMAVMRLAVSIYRNIMAGVLQSGEASLRQFAHRVASM
jgi:hypothetical protein